MAKAACIECGRDVTGKKVVRKMCSTCYRAWRHKNAPPSLCHPDRPEYVTGVCQPCYMKSRAQKRTSEDRDKEAIRYRRRAYDINDGDIEALFDMQGGVCAICGDIPMVVDHNHVTGNLRGLLCRTCNTGIGHLHDSIPTLKAAIRYLETAEKRATEALMLG